MTNQPPISGLKDNHRRGKVGDFLRGKLRPGAELSFVSAYFTIYAYEALSAELDQIGHLRFLFGEPRFIQSLDPSKTEEKAFEIADDKLELKNRLQQKRVARECADWLQKKAEIRSIKQAGFLHGKMYHIDNAGVEDALLGSSNFTVRGLGLAASGNNIELNLEVDSGRDRRDLKAWFDELWRDDELTQDVNDEVLSYLAQLYQDHAPEFIYFKTLYHLFEQFLRELDEGGLLDEKLRLTESEVWKKLFDFQRDGVRAAINKLLRHGGCILADSVGLGKTWEALAVIKYFELRNERVLVLCPKKLRGNWDIYPAHAANLLNPFPNDRYGFTVLSHTDLSREQGQVGSVNLASFHWENFDLIVIDESHNFRNDTKGKPDKDGNVRKSRYEKLIEDVISQGVKTKVLLLSATPVNNDLSDLRNQLRLITAGNDAAFAETLSIPNLANTLKAAQGEFTKWAKQPPSQRDSRELLARLDSAFFKLLDELTIARSRDHIRSFYQKEMARLGGFPERAKPDSRYVEHIDLQREFPNYEALYERISKFRLSLYNPSRFVKPEHASLYENRIGNFTQAGRETFLLGMMRVGFLKRLESSVHSFATTLDRTIQKIARLEERISKHQRAADGKSQVELAKLLEGVSEGDDELRDALEVGLDVSIPLAHMRLDDWLAELAADKKTLGALHAKAKLVAEDATRDGKLADLKGVITAKVRKPTPMKDGTANRKLVVFTAFADTARYLYDQLAPWAEKELGIHSGLVTGGDDRRATFGSTDFDAILTNFAPRAKERHKKPSLPQDGEIDLLIATDCISEGQNLQDSDTVINYDIHWNPVRLIQRFGRVDRIGSRAVRVHLVNYWPVKELDRYVKLKDRVETRMALVDLTATGDDNLLDEKRLKAAGIEDAKEAAQIAFDFRDEQLKRLQNEVLDLEDMNDSIALTDFTLDAFRAELARYVKANEQALKNAPLGLYACVPGHSDKSADIAPGVIFCMRERDHDADLTVATRDRLNPLRPYWLAYVHDTGDVRYTYAHPKRILEIFRDLCVAKSTAHADLCALFDQQTQQGEDMTTYSALLDKALASFSRTFQKQAAALLQTGRDFVIPKASEQPSEKTDFELVSWLVLLNGGEN